MYWFDAHKKDYRCCLGKKSVYSFNWAFADTLPEVKISGAECHMRLRGCLWLAKTQLLKSHVLETTEIPPCLLPIPGPQQLSVKWQLAG